jgi:hypothetical protein
MDDNGKTKLLIEKIENCITKGQSDLNISEHLCLYDVSRVDLISVIRDFLSRKEY